MAKHKTNKSVSKSRCPSCNSMVLTLHQVPNGAAICQSCRAAANQLRTMSKAATTETVEVNTEPTRDI